MVVKKSYNKHKIKTMKKCHNDPLRPNVNVAYAHHPQLLTLPSRTRKFKLSIRESIRGSICDNVEVPMFNICDVLDYSAIVAAQLVVLHTNLVPVFVPLIASMLPKELFELNDPDSNRGAFMDDYDIRLSIDPMGGDKALECQVHLVYEYFNWVLKEALLRSLTMFDFWNNLIREKLFDRPCIDGDVYVAFHYMYREQLFEWGGCQLQTI
jgi:hypothetical protein